MFHVETNNFWLSRATSPMSPHSIEPALPFDASASCKAVVFTHGRLHLSHSDHLHSNTQLSVISTFFLSGRARLTLWSPLGWLSFNIFLFTLRNSSPFRRLCYIRGKANIKETQILDKKSADILRAAGQRQLRFFFFLSFGLLHTTSNWLRQLYGAALSGPPETSSSSSSSFFGESTTGVTFVPLGLTPIETCQLPHQRNNRAVSQQQKQQLFRRENKQRLLYLRPQKKRKEKQIQILPREARRADDNQSNVKPTVRCYLLFGLLAIAVVHVAYRSILPALCPSHLLSVLCRMRLRQET